MLKSRKMLFFVGPIILVSIFSCINSKEDSSSFVLFVSNYVPIEFKFPHGWYKNEENNPYDLQCFSKLQQMNTGVFAFKKIDITTSSTPHDIFLLQIDDMRSKRNNFEIFEVKIQSETIDKILTTITFTGEKEHFRYCYKYTLIEFVANDSAFAVVLQVTSPGQWEKNKSILNDITQSARLLPISK